MNHRSLFIVCSLLVSVASAERAIEKEIATYVPKPGDKWAVMEIRIGRTDYSYEAVPEKLYDARKKEYITVYEYKYEKWRAQILDAKYKREAAEQTLYGIKEFDSERVQAQSKTNPDVINITYNIKATLNNGTEVKKTLLYRDIRKYKGDVKKAFIGEVIKKDKQFKVELDVDPGPKPITPKIKIVRKGLKQDAAMKQALDRRIKMQKKKR
ncbi:MAG: hypothetical protein QGF00_06545 [Planctomycetota bacterium]|jgi:hypothetical protein|nr:hypothetical protein [Planctomycetota bacterium]MDP7249241.1 hypothetical protein [Planctomycetota bacterium]